MHSFDVEFRKLEDMKDAAFRDGREQRELMTMGVWIDPIDDYVTAEYHLLAPTAGLDAVAKPRVAVWMDTLEDYMLHGVYEFDAPHPVSDEYLKEVGKLWEHVGYALQHGDSTIPWNGETLIDEIAA